MRATHELYKYALALLLALAGGANVWGQAVTGDRYEPVWQNVSISASDATFSNVSNGNRIFDTISDNYAEINTDETGTITIDAGVSNRIGQIVISFATTTSTDWWGNTTTNYYSASRVTVSTNNNNTGNFTQIGNSGTISNNSTSVTIPLTGAAQRYIQLSIEAQRYRNTRITSIAFQEEAEPIIRHKPAKWYDLQESLNLSEAAKAMDTFLGTGEEGSQSMYPINLDNELEIQAAHTYIDTIYMHKGSSIRLTLPDIQTSEALSSVASYQRWYSFRTDKTFRTRNTGPNEVWDLLTPLESYSVKTTSNGWQTIDPTVYRFANGYVGNPVATLNGSYLYTNSAVEMNFYYPTNDQFTNWFGLTNQASNDYYIVACDVSCYTDYTKDFDISTSGSSTFYPSSNSDGEIYEPTLSHRVLFYIVGVDDRTTTSDHWKWYNQLTTPAYQGGTANGNYLEEYDITFPYTRVSNHTLDLVALSKNAGSYAIPDISDDTKQLDVTLGTNGAGITLQNATVSDEDRVIQFRYPNSRADGTWYVDGNGNGDSKATILVTKKVGGTTYNIAKYNLNFLKGTQMLSQQQVADIEDKNKVDGKDGYSIIGQGKIDEILSNKSEDRRKIFEEAAES